MSENLNQPPGDNEMPRYAGPGTMFRLPQQANANGLDVATAGIGPNIGTSNRLRLCWAAISFLKCYAARRVANEIVRLER